MTDQSLRRADGLLVELVELVETARAMPMSSSCVLPREKVLDLLDELRETMPPEMDQARRLMAARDALLQAAHEEAIAAREKANAAADTIVALATQRADELARDADLRAHEIVEGGRAEHTRLVSATGVHQAAAETAAVVRAEAQQFDTETRAAAERFDAQTRAGAERFDSDTRADAEQYAHATRRAADDYAAKLTGDAENYADQTLAELADTLHRAAATAEQGRAALAERRGSAGLHRQPDAPITE
jgi:cell division septum initiation protein DivIVA